jgi:hypothetical protein
VFARFAAVVVAAAGVTSLAVLAYAHDTSSSEAETEHTIQRQLPRPRDYSFVALPTTQPPGDAYVKATQYADNHESGQLVMLQYDAFTVYACAEQIGSPAEGTCRRDRTLLRAVRAKNALTVWSVSTKNLDDAQRAAPGLFHQVSTYVAQAEFTTTPRWVRPYAEEQVRTRMFGQ